LAEKFLTKETTEVAEEIVVEIETETEGGRDRDRDGDRKEVENQKNENMTRFFFNLGKRDQLKKMDMLEIINKATAKSKKRADIGDIEILEKFSFFEVEKSFKEEVLKGIASQKFKGKDMRAEVATNLLKNIIKTANFFAVFFI
jgi:hypothetical protein